MRDVGMRLAKAEVEVAFLALHGRFGEDGTIQGLLELMGIPYTGSGVLASALGMNKVAAKKVVRQSGIPTPDYCEIGSRETAVEAARRVIDELGLPVMLKPVEEGSSLGVAKCKTEAELAARHRRRPPRVRPGLRRALRGRHRDHGGRDRTRRRSR